MPTICIIMFSGLSPKLVRNFTYTQNINKYSYNYRIYSHKGRDPVRQGQIRGCGQKAIPHPLMRFALYMLHNMYTETNVLVELYNAVS